MNLQCVDKETREVLASAFLVIPRFQRPYSWDTENVDDFWHDTIVGNERNEYFIGSVVVYTQKPQQMCLVDGQQRFTTLTMMLCAIRNSLAQEGNTDLADGIHAMIERKDINNKNRFILETKTSSPYLQDWIQSRSQPQSGPPINAEERRLAAAYEQIKKLIRQQIEEARQSRQQQPAQQRAVRERLVALRDRLLSLRFIHVTLDNEDDAYLIFETLNTRGKDLRLSDVVKTHLFNRLKPSSASIDPHRDQWDDLTDEFDKANVSVSRYIHHYWLSRNPYVAEKKVYKAIRKTVTSANAKDVFNHLIEGGDRYLTIHDPRRRQWTLHERTLKNALGALALFRVRQPMPMLIAIMNDYEQKELTRKQVENALVAIESFHFVFTAVVSARGSGGIASMYAKHARELTAATSKDQKNRTIRELTKKLSDSRPGFPEFEANFESILNSERYAKQKGLAQYILRRMHASGSKQNEIDYSNMTIEHLRSQSTASGVESHKLVAMLGNQILIPDKLNQGLGSKSFSEKQKALRKQQLTWVDQEVLDAKEWNQEAIMKRTKAMARRAYDVVWK